MIPVHAQLSPGSIVADKFRVLGPLGSGGMGQVLKVEHLYTKYIGALKILSSECAPQSKIVQRFLREASAAGRIGSPHIVEMYDAGVASDGTPYLFMEYLAGISLEQLLSGQGKLSLQDAAEICCEAALGIGAAHQAGIVHRDVKPANLFLTRQEGKRILKVLDFGISKFETVDVTAGITTTGTTMGTLPYMSYEQLFESDRIDARTDIYSLGVVLYECLTGRFPFRGETMAAQGAAVAAGKYPRLRDLRDDVTPAWEELVDRCLAVQREQRWPTMNALFEALSSQLEPRTSRTDEHFALTRTVEDVQRPSREAAPDQNAPFAAKPRSIPETTVPMQHLMIAAVPEKNSGVTSEGAPATAHAPSAWKLRSAFGLALAAVAGAAITWSVLSTKSNAIRVPSASPPAALPVEPQPSPLRPQVAPANSRTEPAAQEPVGSVPSQANELQAPPTTSTTSRVESTAALPTPATAPKVTQPRPLSISETKQCNRLLQKLTLGEPLSTDEREFQRSTCHGKASR